MDILNRTYSIQILVGSENKRKKLRIYLLQGQQGTKERITSVRNNINSPIRTSAIGLLQHLQLLYLPSELDIDEQIQQVTLYFYCMQYQYHPVIPTFCFYLVQIPTILTEMAPLLCLYQSRNPSSQEQRYSLNTTSTQIPRLARI
jgi:hypothetical protein